MLGYGNAPGELNGVNRRRLERGLRSRHPLAASSLLVLSGGAVRSTVPEAELMAAHLRGPLGYRGALALETESRSTEDNVRLSVPFLEGADRIVLASDPLHELRAQEFLRRLRPDLAVHLAPADRSRPLEGWWLRPAEAVIGIEGLRRARMLGSWRA